MLSWGKEDFASSSKTFGIVLQIPKKYDRVKMYKIGNAHKTSVKATSFADAGRNG